MFSQAISHLKFKLPLITIIVLIISLVGSKLVGLLDVQIGTPHPRLFLIISAYLLVVSAIIFVNLKITTKQITHLTCTPKVSTEDWSKKVGSQTQQNLKKLYSDTRYRQWTKQRSEQSRSNIVYEMIEQDSDEEQENITQHKVATMKKLF